jgi:hypothetical protein
MRFPCPWAVGGVLLLCSTLLPACKSPTDVIVPTLPPAPPASVLLFDDFDSENGGVGVNNWSTFAQWLVASGCVDLHGNGFFDVQAGHGLYVDLDGTCSQGGALETRELFSLQPGNYVLEFWLAGNNRNSIPDTVAVSLGTLHQEQIVMQRDDQFRLFTRSISVTSPVTARLRFQNLGGDNQGALLDLVRFRRTD